MQGNRHVSETWFWMSRILQLIPLLGRWGGHNNAISATKPAAKRDESCETAAEQAEHTSAEMRCELRVQSSSTADHTETRNTAKVFLWLLGGREIMVRPSHVEDRNHWRATGWWNQRLWKALHTTRFHKLRDARLTQRRCHAQKNKSFHVTLLSEGKFHPAIQYLE